MPSLTGPLFSLGASGTLKKSVTFSRWRGIAYARAHAIPTNPNSAAQQAQRNTFQNLSALWQRFPTSAQAPWTARAAGQPFTNRNVFFKQNIEQLFGETDLNNLVLSPGNGGAIAPASMVVTPGNDQLTVDLVAPTLPPGWTIAFAWVAATPDEDYTTAQTAWPTAIGSDATSTYQVVLTGLLNATLYQVRGFFEWIKPDGEHVYSPDLAATGLTT